LLKSLAAEWTRYFKGGNVRFLSICSGMEAASIAFGPLGWKAGAFSEIDPACCDLLAHHYPGVPNLGDMTALDFIERAKAHGPTARATR